VAWDENLGAEMLDLILLNHFAEEFQEKHGIDIRSFPKAVAKLKRQVQHQPHMCCLPESHTFACGRKCCHQSTMDFRTHKA